MRIVLASGSPRRRELLGKIVDSFEVITADVDERSIEDRIEEELKGLPMNDVALSMVKQLSLAKAAAVYEKLGCPKDTIVIGADTAVAVSDEIMGKPVDRADAVRMLRKLSLEKQYVLTGVSIISEKEAQSFAEISLVVFNALDELQEERIKAYCDTEDPYDKAGAYGIQSMDEKLIDHIEGDFDNIMGFPTEKVREKLKEYI